MNAVIYHSNTGNCHAIAAHVAGKLGFPLLDMERLPCYDFEDLVVVFPVHCQNIPEAVRPVLSRLTGKNVVLLAAYGRMGHGNVLQECQRRYGWNIVGGAYIPTSHCYIPGDPPFTRWEELDFVDQCFRTATPVSFPRCFKNPLADCFPGLRTRLGIRLIRGKSCTHCGLCTSLCHRQKCIRCLKCVQRCPVGALRFCPSLFMWLYLKKPPKDDLVIYAPFCRSSY